MTSRRRRAFILGFTLLLLPICMLIAFTMVEQAITDSRFAFRTALRGKVFYMAEAGLNIGYSALANSNFSQTTNDATGLGPPAKPLVIKLPGFSTAGNGWQEWQWNPGDPPSKSYTGTGQPESFQIRAYCPAPNQFHIDCVATLGNESTWHLTAGTINSTFTYAIFSSGDLMEFRRAHSETVNGSVHANGTMWFNPSSSTLTLNTAAGQQITSAGPMIRYTDDYGAVDGDGEVLINGVKMPGYADGLVDFSGTTPLSGIAFDTTNPNWLSSGAAGAWQQYNGAVQDQSLGGHQVTPPQLPSFQPGGYYDTIAGMHVSASSAPTGYMSNLTFPNNATGMTVNAKQIDVAKLQADPSYPTNRLIYCTTPVVLVNGENLTSPITIISDSTIYTFGSFNRIPPGATEPQLAALMTSDQIWTLSYAFDFATGNSDGSTPAEQVPAYAGPAAAPWFAPYSSNPAAPPDPNANANPPVLEVNCAFVDGSYTIMEQNYATINPTTGQTPNPYYTGTDTSAAGLSDPSFQDQFLESWGIELKRYGSIVHLQDASMASFDNSNAGPQPGGRWNTPWRVESHYNPPQRNYIYDKNLASPAAASMVGWPVTGTKVLWRVMQ